MNKRVLLLFATMLLGIGMAKAQTGNETTSDLKNENDPWKGRWGFIDEFDFYSQKGGTGMTFQVGGIYNVSNMLAFTISGAYDCKFSGEGKNSLRIPVSLRLYTLRHGDVDVVPYAGLAPVYTFNCNNLRCGGQAGLDLVLYGFKVGIGWYQTFGNNSKPRLNCHIGYDIRI